MIYELLNFKIKLDAVAECIQNAHNNWNEFLPNNFLHEFFMLRFSLACSICLFTFVSANAELPVLLQEDFEKGADHWQPLDAKQWKLKQVENNQVFSLFEKKGGYKPPHRSPVNICLLKEHAVEDFQLTAKVLSTHADYGHRDSVIVFGYQDPAHFYYVHLASKADDHANQIFIVNNEARKKISLTTTTGTKWDDNWHTLRVARNVKAGSIEIFFDDLEKPVMTAKDDTFQHGRIGIGSFDDTNDWDTLELRGHAKK
jgi:hypothetical protein